ncbi:MAG TPA: hypothetical protein VK780_11540 [Thermoanaerobaculia bacterium]|nr:hypothetical protein [Thermoanaerobaculia bacterium]
MAVRSGMRPLARLLDELEEWKLRRAGGVGSLLRLLSELSRRDLRRAADLARLHEAALFLRAYPHSRRVREATESILRSVPERVARLEESGEGLSLFDELEYAGVAGTTVATEFTYPVTRWLAENVPGIEASWDVHEQPDRLGEGLTRFVPLLEEEALADAVVPHLEWLRAAVGPGGRDLPWLLDRFERLDKSEAEKAELFDALGVVTSWRLGRSRYSRTLLRKPGPAAFFHAGPLLSRRETDFAGILAGPPMPVRRLTRREGEAMVDVTRGTTTARYREFYGFTHGDRVTAIAGRPGRGLEIFFFGIRPEARLPLRATHTAIYFVNGIAVGYFEGLSLFERMEVGFNIYYTFREGESAWLYAQVLRLCRQITGVSSFSIDPYQIGHENKEAIESGAFWFYRKLGFRPTDPKVAALVEREERKIAQRPGYRTSAATLHRIATCNLLYEVDQRRAPSAQRPSSDWDRFHVRRLGLAVNRRMARQFEGNAERIRVASTNSVARKLRVNPGRWKEGERKSFEKYALVLDLLPDLARWSREEKRDLVAVIRSKAGRAEASYLRRMQRHQRLRQSLIELGSRSRSRLLSLP